MVVVNGQVFQEGNALTPELKLEQIRQKSAVFSIRGTEYRAWVWASAVTPVQRTP